MTVFLVGEEYSPENGQLDGEDCCFEKESSVFAEIWFSGNNSFASWGRILS